jgi:hypothetical protein
METWNLIYALRKPYHPIRWWVVFNAVHTYAKFLCWNQYGDDSEYVTMGTKFIYNMYFYFWTNLKIIYLSWRIWPLIGNDSVNTFSRRQILGKTIPLLGYANMLSVDTLFSIYFFLRGPCRKLIGDNISRISPQLLQTLGQINPLHSSITYSL